jgi:quercetin dioxygenase-like cupin family protein
MKTTVFSVHGDGVASDVWERPPWRPLEEYDREPLEDVRLVELRQGGNFEIQLVEMGAGGHFAMHSSPDVAFCQIVRGRGKLGLPAGTEISYQGPELYVFLPHTLHDWHDIEQDTLLSVCLVKQS